MSTEIMLCASALGLTAFSLTGVITPIRWLRVLSNLLWAAADGLQAGTATAAATFRRLKGDIAK